jgi:hypothetical protein
VDGPVAGGVDEEAMMFGTGLTVAEWESCVFVATRCRGAPSLF